MTRVRVLLVSASFHPRYGGPAVSVSGLARALAEGGAEVAIWAPDGSATKTPLLGADCKVVRAACLLPRLIHELGRLDIIHDNGVWLPHNHRVATLASRLEIPRVVSTRGMLEPWALSHKGWKKKIAWAAYQRRDLRSAAALHATAPAEARNLAALGLQRPIYTIPNGVDLPEHLLPNGRPAFSDTRTALFIGRLHPKKGLLMLIQAWATARPQGWRLAITGPDEAGHQRELQAAVAAAGLEKAVSLLEPVAGDAKNRAFREADLLVLPSHSENFGMVVAEALAHGLPVLTTTATPWSQLAAAGCGWQVEPSIPALTEGLRHATAIEPATLRAMGARGRAMVERELAWPNIVGRFIDLYKVAA
jgi:glycosyltransferase involved in cell wall biosynthesis